MTFTPAGEKIIEKKICHISGQEFFVTDKDLKFYDKISPIFGGKKYSIPSPVLSPEERARQRMIFRNFTHFYHRKSDFSGNSIISMYRPELPYKVYSTKEWWSDEWTGFDYGYSFDFQKSFSENMSSLHRNVPRMALMNRESENCDYANLCWKSKNCYLVSGCVGNEDCIFGHLVWKSKHIYDGLYIYESEKCYDCVDCVGSYGLQFCQDCKNSRDCWYCINCSGCRNCIGCSGLIDASYHVFNQPVSPQEFAQRLAEIYGRDLWKIPHFSQKLTSLRNTTPTQYIQGLGNENVVGNAIYFSKNCFECYDIKRSENLKYCATVNQFHNSQDINFSPDTSDFCYQGIAITGNNILFCHNCTSCSQILYCDNCYNSQQCFGCVGLKNVKNCILNVPYSQHEYETIVPKIIHHMMQTNEWGAFIDYRLSPFGYQETIAKEYFPLGENIIKERGYTSHVPGENNTYIGTYYTSLPISQYDEKVVGYETATKNIHEILEGIIECEITKKPFKIIKQELVFYIENGISIPTKHPDQRHKERMDLRNPRTLYEKTCAECQKEIITTYSGERPEKVVCEECYRKLVY